MLLGLLLAITLVAAACGDDDEDATETSTASDDSSSSEGETFEIFALLPQGNDQPYGTTYLPPFEAKAAELGLNLNINQLTVRRRQTGKRV